MGMDQYLNVFLDESREHVQNLNSGLLALEQEPENMAQINEIFRSAHTLKGMSATMGFEEMAGLTHQMENILDACRNSELQVRADVIEGLLQGLDDLEEMVEDISSGGTGKKDVTATAAALAKILKSDSSVPAKEDEQGTGLEYEAYEQEVIRQSIESGFQVYETTVRFDPACQLKAARAYMVVSALEGAGDIIKSVPHTEELEKGEVGDDFILAVISQENAEAIKELVLSVSEISSADVRNLGSALKQEASEPEKEQNAAGDEKKIQTEANTKKPAKRTQTKTIRVNIDRLNDLMNRFEELVIDRGRLESIAEEKADANLKETVERLGRVTRDMQDMILKLRMEPVEQVFNRFPRMVRNTAKDLGKTIELAMSGTDTELDRTVIDEIGDPLVHLIRNSMDHGIESPASRTASGKPETGHISLRAYHQGNDVYIEIEDDGAGIDRDKVLGKAIEKSLVTEEESKELSDNDVFQLMFQSGFSTADKISDLSGRGVGLDVVKSKIESLGGRVHVKSERHKGSVFTIQLPLTLSIIRAMLCQIGEERYAIPLSSIAETTLADTDAMYKANTGLMMDYRERLLPVTYFGEAMEVPGFKMDKKRVSVVIAKNGNAQHGFIVDRLIGQQEVVIKPLGSFLSHVKGFSGATILGDGQVALIADMNHFIK